MANTERAARAADTCDTCGGETWVDDRWNDRCDTCEADTRCTDCGAETEAGARRCDRCNTRRDTRRRRAQDRAFCDAAQRRGRTDAFRRTRTR